jgi:hypothetical protein
MAGVIAEGPLEAWRGRAEKIFSPAHVEMNDYQRDYNFGADSENEVLEALNKVFNTELCKTSRYSKMDFTSDWLDVELKSRNVERNTYKSTIVPKSKIDYIKRSNQTKKYVFAFRFTDGLYYIEYDDKVFESFECKMFVRSERTGTNDVKQLYYHIPVDQLKCIETVEQKVARCGKTYDA